MTYPRSQLVEPNAPGVYHCVSRCVRRAFLCGKDPLTGRDYEPRRQWIETRLLELAGIFAIGLYGYAVMHNHVHAVLAVNPSTAKRWSDATVAERWMALFPIRNAEIAEQRRRTILSDPELLAKYRTRLTSVSWFMRCLAEPIARRANREDDVTGRFWEGRFKCQALLDDTAILATLTYVDLNPIRAQIAPDLKTSRHTSIARRLAAASRMPKSLRLPLAPIAGPRSPLVPSLSERDYVEIADYTGRQWHPTKNGRIAGTAPAALRRLDLDGADWTLQVRGIGSGYWRAIGAVDRLLEKARAMNQQWLCGIGFARQLAS